MRVDDPDYSRSEEVHALAEKTNCDILPATPFTLQLDIDSAPDLAFFKKQFSRLRNFLPFESYSVLRSRSKKWHVIVKLHSEMPVRERIMLQSIMGSDRVREALSLIRVLEGDECPILLLRPKDAKEES